MAKFRGVDTGGLVAGASQANALTARAGELRAAGIMALGEGIARGLEALVAKKREDRARAEREGARAQDFAREDLARRRQDTALLLSRYDKEWDQVNNSIQARQLALGLLEPGSPDLGRVQKELQHAQQRAATLNETRSRLMASLIQDEARRVASGAPT